MEPETFEQFAKRLNLCKVCAGSKIDPKSNTGSPDDNHWACVACLGTGMEPLTFGSLFAGVGGFDLGFERAGMVCKFQVEIDPYCQKVLAKHWPNVARWDDVTTLTKEVIKEIINDQIKKGGTGEATASGTIDVLCGGFP